MKVLGHWIIHDRIDYHAVGDNCICNSGFLYNSESNGMIVNSTVCISGRHTGYMLYSCEARVCVGNALRIGWLLCHRWIVWTKEKIEG